MLGPKAEAREVIKTKKSQSFSEKSPFKAIYKHFLILELAQIFRISGCCYSEHIFSRQHTWLMLPLRLPHTKTSFSIQTSGAFISGTDDSNMSKID
jgi:hypothetical protein